MFDFRFDKSYGDPQEVRVLAKRSLGAVTLKYQVNGGAVQSAATTSVWTMAASATAPGSGTYYHVIERHDHGHQPRPTASRSGSRAAARRATRSPTPPSSETGNPVLVMAAEDYTGASPVQA